MKEHWKSIITTTNILNFKVETLLSNAFKIKLLWSWLVNRSFCIIGGWVHKAGVYPLKAIKKGMMILWNKQLRTTLPWLSRFKSCATVYTRGVGSLWGDKALEGQVIVCEQWFAPPMLCLLRTFLRLWFIPHSYKSFYLSFVLFLFSNYSESPLQYFNRSQYTSMVPSGASISYSCRKCRILRPLVFPRGELWLRLVWLQWDWPDLWP